MTDKFTNSHILLQAYRNNARAEVVADSLKKSLGDSITISAFKFDIISYYVKLGHIRVVEDISDLTLSDIIEIKNEELRVLETHVNVTKKKKQK